MKKLYSIIVAFILLMAIILPSKVEAKQVFSDVPVTHANYADIMYLLEKGVIQESSKYGVTDIVTREEVAVMVAKAVGLDGTTPTDTKFSDVKKSNKNSGYIQAAVNAGIVNGYGDNTFKPNQKVTRGHMAAFIARAFDLPAGKKTFKDVPTNHTAYEAVKKLAAANITTGYGDGTFKPENSLTRAHISAFLARAMKFADGVIADPILEEEIRKELNKPEGDLTREDMLKLTSLNVKADGYPIKIKDLSGLEYAKNLKSLVLTHNEIKDIHMLSDLTQLTELSLSNNLIADASVVNSNKNLEYLDISSNNMTNFKLADLTSLKHLDISKNKLTDISLTNLPNLEYYDQSYNMVDGFQWLIPASKMKYLNISNSDMKILDFNLNTFPNLEILVNDGNRLDSPSMTLINQLKENGVIVK